MRRKARLYGLISRKMQSPNFSSYLRDAKIREISRGYLHKNHPAAFQTHAKNTWKFALLLKEVIAGCDKRDPSDKKPLPSKKTKMRPIRFPSSPLRRHIFFWESRWDSGAGSEHTKRCDNSRKRKTGRSIFSSTFGAEMRFYRFKYIFFLSRAKKVNPLLFAFDE